MIHTGWTGDCFEIAEYIGVYHFDRETMRFPSIDFGSSKTSIVYEIDGKAVVRIGGKTHWSGMGKTKYYPPEYMVGTLRHDIFTQYYRLTYTRKYAPEIWTRDVGAGHGVNYE